LIVEDTLTPLSPSAAAAALSTAYQQLIGSAPTQAVLGLVIAQSALETDGWQKIHNFNFGNQKAGADYPAIVQFRCSEIVDGVEKFFDPPDPTCNFRAYQSASEGALDYLRVLHSRPHWWQGLQTGDPSAFVDALATTPKYFTASPALYKRALLMRLQQFAPLLDGALDRRAQGPVAPPHPWTVRVLAAHRQELGSRSALVSSLSDYSSRRFVALDAAGSERGPRATHLRSNPPERTT